MSVWWDIGTAPTDMRLVLVRGRFDHDTRWWACARLKDGEWVDAFGRVLPEAPEAWSDIPL